MVKTGWRSGLRNLAPLAVVCACAGAAHAQGQHAPPAGPVPGGAQGPSGNAASNSAETPRLRPGSPFDFRPAQGFAATGQRAMPTRFGQAIPQSPNTTIERQHYMPAPFVSAPAVDKAAQQQAPRAADADAKRTGRMTEQERRELRQNIEDAGRDVYRPKP